MRKLGNFMAKVYGLRATLCYVVMLGVAGLLAACGGGSSIVVIPAYTIGGTVSGLAGTGLVLQDNNANDLVISANGAFTFAIKPATGTAYSVSVKIQPSGPGQVCTVNNGTGTVASANVTGITVICSTNSYNIGGMVSGLAGSGLVLQDNNADNLAISVNGAFTFATKVADGAGYSVSVKTQPGSPAQTCTANSSAGTVAGANVTTVTVICSTNSYSVGGTISKLAGSGLVLQNNNADDLAIAANGAFTFATPVAAGAGYNVTVKTQPGSPAQTCIPGSATGTIAAASVTGVTVTCSEYLMGGAKQGTALNLTGTVTTLAGTPFSKDASGNSASFNLPKHMVQVGGNLYVADYGNHTIRQIVLATGVVTTLAGSPGLSGTSDGTGAAARFNNPMGIASDGTNVYVADTMNQTIRQVVIATGAVTTLAGSTYGYNDGTGTAALFKYPYDLATDGTNLYVADINNHVIRQIVIATGAVSTLAGTAGATGTTDATGTAARFNGPRGIVTDGSSLYVMDTGNGSVRRIAPASGALTAISSTNAVVTTLASGFNIAAGGITTDGSSLYVAQSYENAIYKIAPSSGSLSAMTSVNAVTTLFAGYTTAFGSTDATGTAARFNNPFGVAADATNLYVTDTNNFTIRKIVLSSGVVSTFAGTALGSDGTGAAARFNTTNGMTTDGSNLYVADTANHTIRKVVISSGAVTTLAGLALTSGSADGTGVAARFSYPSGITTDGNVLYVADAGNHTIRKIDITSGAVTTLAGSPGLSGISDGTGSVARFNSPSSITTDGNNLYVADTVNHTLRKITPLSGALSAMTSANAVVTTLAGTAGATGSTNASGASARFYFPYGITTDGTNLYVADTSNSTIRQVVISTGAVTTLAGTALTYAAADGAGSAASFRTPYGITTDGTNLYVADTANYTIRKIVISSGVVTTLAGTSLTLGSSDGSGTSARFWNPWGITTDGANLFVGDSAGGTVRVMH